MLVIVTGLSEEAEIVRPGLRDGDLLLCGSRDRDTLSSRVPVGCEGIVSFGVCGGLNPQVPVGSLVVASQVKYDPYNIATANQVWSDRLLRATLLLYPKKVSCYSSVLQTASTPAQRLELSAETGASIVDMESGVVAAVAADKGIPFAVLRAVSDGWDQTVSDDPLDTNPDGSANIAEVLKGLVEDPAEITELVEEGRSFELALRTLSLAYSLVGLEFCSV